MGRKTAENYAEWVNWIAAHDWNVCGTLNFAPGHKLTGSEAQRVMSTFWNKADRLMYGGFSKYRVERMVFSHGGALGDNTHAQFLAKAPFDPKAFCIGLNALWASMNICTAPPVSNEILPIFSVRKSTEYALHEFWLTGTETFNHALSHLNPLGSTAHEQAQDRLKQATSSIWLARAQLAFDDHMAAAQARYEQRNS